jgi:hypothetical protein
LKRWLFNITAALSLLLCLAVLVLWRLSYPQHRYFTRVTKHFDEHTVQGFRGRIIWTTMFVPRAFPVDDLAEPPIRSGSSLQTPIFNDKRGTPWTVEWQQASGSVQLKTGQVRYPIYRVVAVHFGLVLGLAALLPAAWLMRMPARRRRRRIQRGLCGNCGYDLRASPARCPECGSSAAPPA